MKKFSILFASVAMLFGSGLGVGAAVSSDKSEPVLEAKAESSNVTLYINQFDGGGNWNNFSYYLFGGDKGEKAAWPGIHRGADADACRAAQRLWPLLARSARKAQESYADNLRQVG